MKESSIQSEIIGYLKMRGFIAIRINSGHIHIGNRWIKLADEGTADIIGMKNNGRFFAIEVKRPGEKVTDKQKEFLQKVKRKKGIAIIAQSLEDVIDKIDK